MIGLIFLMRPFPLSTGVQEVRDAKLTLWLKEYLQSVGIHPKCGPILSLDAKFPPLHSGISELLTTY